MVPLALDASTRMMFAPGAMECAHSTSSEISPPHPLFAARFHWAPSANHGWDR